jgi:DNA polymerase-3 subunit epsilon
MESFARAIAAYAEGAVFTAFDIETTGLDPRRDRIVEFGAVKFDRQGVIVRYSVLIDPGIPMPLEAGRVNGITDDMLAGHPPVEEVLPDFLRLIKDTVIVAHNAPFDCGFVNENLARLHRAAAMPFPAMPNKIADTLLLARRFFAGRERYSLQSLASDLGIKAQAAHRALDDARLCMELFIRCCKAASI